MNTTSSGARRLRALDGQSQDLLGDRIMLAAIGFSTLAALTLGQLFDALGLAIGVSVLLLAIACVGYAGWRGRRPARISLTVALVGFVVLHIQLSRGMSEFHFGVFVTLALVLVYRDWRPVVLAAVLFAVHHIAFDRLQAAGFGFYCTTEANLGRILLHATYVLIQTALEVQLAIWLKRAGDEGDELTALVSAVNQDDHIHLDLTGVAVHTPPGQALRSALLRMHEAVTQVQSASTNIETACSEIASGNMDLSHRTEQTAGNLAQAASNMGELTNTVQQSADSANQATQLASSAAQVAEQGGVAVRQVVHTMEEIQTSANRIADITTVIDGIAFQTNLLALNAAVEAARAGEQGRGFAVVAGEVRALAQRSAGAAREIKTLISQSLEKVEAGRVQVHAAGNTMADIVSSVQRVNHIIADISTAASEQSQGIGQVNAAVNELDQMTQQNAALVEQSAAAATNLSEQAKRLMGSVAVFQVR
ncbi:methyl-accepting chemotaxis protein [Curvibacter sp. HBC61]|uniref:Methyl-accepting chemotaxis protein n=1 Tax=Curvibacter cyanobacteriorum TaxID=3026422 RepID=A0ABT5N028_9BURK|nr:methyl-accepting chemotaxis protein [Curvibacter sp. HBC61]MDD0839480.1 methyl-accepting chemotaxis protein [Curvibacter sp. HBC61]